jgi:glycosyltransferase involved in cell wall biosynthesis
VEQIFEGKDEEKERFQVRTARTTSESNFSFYFFRGLRRQLHEFDADVIFPTHESIQTIQMVLWRWLFTRGSRLVFFTMSVHPRVPPLASFHPRRVAGYWLRRVSWWLLCHGTDAAMCHYPAIRDQMQREGYSRPILIQTQIGVDEDLFHPDNQERAIMRAKLGLKGFVVGFVGRIVWEKGILDIGEAIGRLPEEVHLLTVGDGDDKGRLLDLAAKGGWAKRLHLVGYLSSAEVAAHMRAMDCLVLGSRTTEGWVDTFPNVVAQAMSTGLPVVASNSGAIPFMLGDRGLLFQEGSVNEIVDHLMSLRADESLRSRMGQSLRERAISEFCVGGINERLMEFLRSLAQRKEA